MSRHREFLLRAVELSRQGGLVDRTGGPFGAVIVRDGRILAEGTNRVVAENDPTRHAEMEAIRHACAALGDFRLTGCTLYSSAEPCPMCLAAAYWARLDAIHYASTAEDVRDLGGFDDSRIRQELGREPHQRSLPIAGDEQARLAALEVWRAYRDLPGKVPY